MITPVKADCGVENDMAVRVARAGCPLPEPAVAFVNAVFKSCRYGVSAATDAARDEEKLWLRW